jgi:uncharacterized membrane protein (UPF0127 family)
MGKKTKNFILLIILIVVSLSSFYIYQRFLWMFFVKDGQLTNLVLKNNFFSPHGKDLLIEVVKDGDSIKQGLSGRTRLATKSNQSIDGMLFIFPQAKAQYFWMKDMKFDIDICWLDRQILLACSRQALQAGPSQDVSQLPIYQSPQAVNLVLETLPGFLEESAIGDKLYIKLF